MSKRYVVEITTAYAVEADNSEEAHNKVFMGTAEELAQWHKDADEWWEITQVEQEDK